MMAQLMPAAVYLLCFATSVFCVVLLARSYKSSGARLLLWTALSFVGLAAGNLLLFADLVLFPGVDLLPARQLAHLGAVAVLLYGFIWETK
jgi:hypothetical protein